MQTRPAITLMLAAGVLILLAAPLQAGWSDWLCGDDAVEGSGDLTTVTRELESFECLENSISADIKVTIGEPQRVELTCDDNLVDLIRTEVHGHTLEITSEEPYRTRSRCRVEIVVPYLDEVIIRGSGDISVSRLQTEDFRLYVHGSGDFEADGEIQFLEVRVNGSGDSEFENLSAKEVAINIHGSGDISLAGKADFLDISIHGSGNVDARDLTAQDADINVHGSGDSKVTVVERLSATVNGSGNVTYFGDPKDVDRWVNGSGRVRGR